MELDLGELRKPDELAMLYELEPEVRDIIVEGKGDKNFYEWFISEGQMNGLVKVYAAADRVYLPDSELIENGMIAGERNRVLRLSNLLSTMKVSPSSVRLVIDMDLGSIGLDPVSENPYLLYTDFSAVELYAFNEKTIFKLLRVGLGAPDDVTAKDLIESIQPALVALFIIRACLRESRIGAKMPPNAIEGVYGCNDLHGAAGEVFRLALDRVPRQRREGVTRESLLADFCRLEEMVQGDVRHFINGHDISVAIIHYVKLRCRSVFNAEGRRVLQAAPVLEILLMGLVDRDGLKSYPLFSSITAWLTGETKVGLV
ncbi:hypothetical protein GCM10010441_77480 [Kitasatospora paracochleata]|uniref:Uncharacterized protein n=1 Tax=Kitasatospora paracochleata TaxID=58354 RepID=A0ABT1J9X9_9ACTN|nr:DUF4435 domain-containing protein [Kitasatospora paracochleata]MCP2314014.1 hypothetical protein [Kitasatospora paracochleata]